MCPSDPMPRAAIATRPADERRRRAAGARLAGMAWVTVAALSCAEEGAPKLTVVLDATRGTTAHFQPESAFAEYVEIDAARHELRVTLASYETHCDEYRGPEDDEVVLTLALMSPPKKAPGKMEFTASGVPELDTPIAEPVVLPKVRTGKRSYLFQPGGTVKVTSVVLEPRGTVEGSIDLSYPGDAEHPATRVQGRFRAWICRYAPAPKR